MVHNFAVHKKNSEPLCFFSKRSFPPECHAERIRTTGWETFRVFRGQIKDFHGFVILPLVPSFANAPDDTTDAGYFIHIAYMVRRKIYDQ